MLHSIEITDYALISHVHITLDSGFSVLTGETGAGKSILIDALQLILGGRADSHCVRKGAKKCIVEAQFWVHAPELGPWLEDRGIGFNYRDINFRREVSATGKSRAFVNGVATTNAFMRDLGMRLIDIHSQHQNQLLTNTAFLINLIDDASENLGPMMEYSEAFRTSIKTRNALKEIQEQAEAERREADNIQFQYDQLHEAQLRLGEQAELENERNCLAHAEEISDALQTCLTQLTGQENDMLSALRRASHALESISSHLPDAAAWSERLESARIELDDIAATVSHEASNIESDPARLEFVEERLNTLYRLEQKFHVSTERELLLREKWFSLRLSKLENYDAEIAEAAKAHDAAVEELCKAGAALTEMRKKAAEKLSNEMRDLLHKMGMPYAEVYFEFTPRKEAHSNGLDEITLYFSANRGHAPRPVEEVASGGEISRLMLAFKITIASFQGLPTIVFDEIDTGTSGTVAEQMALAMQKLSDYTQVICITHLPQIAAHADAHYRVYKETTETETETHLAGPLKKKERILELANMLSGEKITPAAIENAKTLLKS